MQGVQTRGTGPGEAQAAHDGGQAHSHIQKLSIQVEMFSNKHYIHILIAGNLRREICGLRSGTAP